MHFLTFFTKILQFLPEEVSHAVALKGLKLIYVIGFTRFLFPKNTVSKENSKNLEINFVENKDNFSEEEWRSLYKLSQNTFVEETDSLKKGAAGAGLTDND